MDLRHLHPFVDLMHGLADKAEFDHRAVILDEPRIRGATRGGIAGGDAGLGGNGIATEQIKHANLVSFTCLKSFAFDQRFERKDAHDLIYCIEHAPEGLDAVAATFHKERNGKHGAVVEASLAILRRRFASDENAEGYRKDGPVSVARFELGEGDEPEQREARTLRQRQTCDVIEQLLARIEKER